MNAAFAESSIDVKAKLMLAALKRARRRAERIARATGTSLIESRNGRPVRIKPSPSRNTAGKRAR
jgi:hypothetical protein